MRPNKDISYLQRTLFNPIKNELNYSKWEIEMTYLSTQFLQYHYKIKFCERSDGLLLELKGLLIIALLITTTLSN